MKYKKDFYEYLNGDKSTKGYKIEYMSGPDIVEFGKQFGDFPYVYNWGGQNLSRWDYMKELIDFVEENLNLSSFFNLYFLKIISEKNIDKKQQKNFLIDLNEKLLHYGQKVKIEDKKIVVKKTKATTVLDDIDFEFNVDEEVDISGKAIGQGGYAHILFTSDKNILRKSLRQQHLQDTKIKQRFKEEYRMLKSIENEKYIIPVLEYDENNSSYTMKKAYGSFDDLKKELDDQEKIMFFYQLGESILYIHDNSIFHRDIKGGNCLRLNNRWVLSDFGISKDEEVSSLTTTGNFFGTEGYIHPEILSDPSRWKNYLPKYDYFQYGKTIINNADTISDDIYKNKIIKIGEEIIKTNGPDELKRLIKAIKIIFTEI